MIILFTMRGFLVLTFSLGLFIHIGSPAKYDVREQQMCYRCAGIEECKTPELIYCSWENAYCYQKLDDKSQVINLDCVVKNQFEIFGCHALSGGDQFFCFCAGDRCNGRHLRCEGSNKCKDLAIVKCDKDDECSKVQPVTAKRRCYSCKDEEECKKPEVIDCNWPGSCELQGRISSSEKGAKILIATKLGCNDDVEYGYHDCEKGNTTGTFVCDCGYDRCNNVDTLNDGDRDLVLAA